MKRNVAAMRMGLSELILQGALVTERVSATVFWDLSPCLTGTMLLRRCSSPITEHGRDTNRRRTQGRDPWSWILSDGLAQIFLEMYCGLRLLPPAPVSPSPHTLLPSGAALHCSLPVLPTHPTSLLLLPHMFPLIKVCVFSPISASLSQRTWPNTRLM